MTSNSQMTILIVEDEVSIRDMLSLSLQREHFITVSTENSKQAMEYLSENTPDLILLDWMMPNESGIEFTLKLKQNEKTVDIPIVMLTAKADEDDKITGFNIGIDDYITKPFSIRELVARIKSVIRRSRISRGINEEQESLPQIISISGLNIDIDKHVVYTDDKDEIHLGPTEFKLLHFLMQNASRVYSREKLLNSVWGETVYVEERTVDVHIRRLRKALEPFQLENLIRTVRGSGYSFKK